VHIATLDTALYRIEPRPAAGAVVVDADQIEALWIRRRWKLHYDARGGFISLAVSALRYRAARSDCAVAGCAALADGAGLVLRCPVSMLAACRTRVSGRLRA
jgi:hypothetical protein